MEAEKTFWAIGTVQGMTLWELGEFGQVGKRVEPQEVGAPVPGLALALPFAAVASTPQLEKKSIA